MRTPGRREAKDHERYLRHHDDRKEYQREYYAKNREKILARRRERGPMKVIIKQ